MNKKVSIWYLIGLIVLIMVLIKQCEPQPEIKTVTKIVKVTDTIRSVKIQEIPKIVYVQKIKTVKGNDSIVYVDKPTVRDSLTVQANQYDTELKSQNATAKLKITTTGEILDLSGTITYPEKETTITKIQHASGLFLYGQTNLNGFNSYGAGVDYVFKNKIIIGCGLTYDTFVSPDNVNINVKLGFKIF